MSYRKFTVLLSTLLVAWFEVAAGAAVNFDAPGAFNPIVPGYFADPTIKKFGDTYYIFATTDGNGGGRGPSQVWMSHDLFNWTLAPMNWPLSKKENYWVSDVVKRNGRYFLYFDQLCITFGAVGDTPIGPWEPGDQGGLMARLAATGRSENLVALSSFPPWNQGNMFTSTINGGRRRKGNMLGFNAKRHLQIVRIESQVHFRIRDNGQDWTEILESPVARPDQAGNPMQVGWSRASYGEQSSFISFNDFRLTTKR